MNSLAGELPVGFEGDPHLTVGVWPFCEYIAWKDLIVHYLFLILWFRSSDGSHLSMGFDHLEHTSLFILQESVHRSRISYLTRPAF